VSSYTLQSVCKALSSTVRIAVVQFIREHEPASVQQVASAFFGSPERPLPARRVLKVLREAGLCTRVRIGREDFYTYTGHLVLPVLVAELRTLLGEDDDSSKV